MKKAILTPNQMALMSKALLGDLFPKPKKGQLVTNCDTDDDNCIFYFEEDYFNVLFSAINGAFIRGDFARSNIEDEWNDFMIQVTQAVDTDEDTNNCKTYPFSID